MAYAFFDDDWIYDKLLSRHLTLDPDIWAKVGDTVDRAIISAAQQFGVHEDNIFTPLHSDIIEYARFYFCYELAQSIAGVITGEEYDKYAISSARYKRLRDEAPLSKERFLGTVGDAGDMAKSIVVYRC